MMFVHPVTHDAHGLALKKMCLGASSRSIFIVWKRSFLYDKNALCRECSQSTGPRIPIYWQALQLHQHEHIVDRANGVFEIPVAHADDDV